MIKSFKKGSYKISAAVILLCLVVSSLTHANASAEISSVNPSVSTEAAGTLDKGDGLKFKIGNDSLKQFYSLERAVDYAGFDFKVPDFLPSGFELYDVFLDEKKIDNQNELLIQFWTNMNVGRSTKRFDMQITKGNLLQYLKKKQGKADPTIQEEAMEISGVKGTFLTKKLNYIESENHKPHTIGNLSKFFIWQDESVWYSINCFESEIWSDGRTDVFNEISMEDLQKVAGSFKYAKEVKDARYSSKAFGKSLNIYDEKDLKRAEELLGFAPKLPSTLAGGFVPSRSNVYEVTRSSYDEKDNSQLQKTPSTLMITIYNIGGKELNDDNAGSLEIIFDQGKDMFSYNALKKGYVNVRNPVTGKVKKVKPRLLSIKGNEVFTYNGGGSGSTVAVKYVWKQNEVCYTAEIPVEVKNQEEIIKAMVEAPSPVFRSNL